MAGLDYLKCEICGERLQYDPDSTIVVVCMKCYNKLLKKLTKQKKILIKHGITRGIK